MSISDILSRIGKLTIDHSPTILSAIAVTGTITTAILAGRASYEAGQIIALKEGTEGVSDDPKVVLRERVRLVWPLYIPAAVSTGVTVACIIGSNRISTRRAAALAAAFSLSEKAFETYRDKVVERVGENQERKIRDEIAQDTVRENPPSSQVVIASGEVLCMDAYSGRYFTSTVDRIHSAKNETNQQVLSEMSASLTDFYYRVGLTRTQVSDDVGWNTDDMLEIQFSSAITPDDKPCLVVNFRTKPIRGYYRNNH